MADNQEIKTTNSTTQNSNQNSNVQKIKSTSWWDRIVQNWKNLTAKVKSNATTTQNNTQNSVSDTQVKYSDSLEAQPTNTSVETQPTSVSSVAQSNQSTQPAAQSVSNQSQVSETVTIDEPLTYEQYLESLKGNYENRYQEELKQIETEQQRQLADANSSYEQNKATYGANAETLAKMGLQGSGYSDYLESQAYRQQREDVQYADALANSSRNEAKLNRDEKIDSIDQTIAEVKYNEEKTQEEREYQEKLLQEQRDYDAKLLEEQRKYEAEQLEEQRRYEAEQQAIADEKQNKANYAELLGYANSGVYNASQLEQIAEQYNLSEEQIKTLTDAADEYKSNKQNETYSNFLSGNDNGFESIKSALDNGEITQNQYNSLLNLYQTNYYDTYTSYVDTDYASVDTVEIDNAFKRGYITQDQYNSIKDRFNINLASDITALSLFKLDGTVIGQKTADVVVKELKESGWVSQDNLTKIQTLYDEEYNKKEEDSGGGGGGGCYAKGTLITTADGTQVAVEDLKEGDNVLVFNHNTGNVDASPISLIFYDGLKNYKVLKLNFDNNTNIEVLYGHGFFDTELKKYVLINADNANEYVGHKFLNISQIVDGEYNKELITLTNYEEYDKETECYSVLTANHINSIANGILTVTDDGNRPANLLKGFYNIFDLDEDYKFDAEKMTADLEQYGLLDYSVLKNYVTEEQFNAFNGPYLNVAVGKGLVTIDEVIAYIQRFLNK